MKLHNIQLKHKNKTKKRIGRGGKKGTYSGKGVKGQSSRAGRKFQPLIREFIKRYPKLRGYRYNKAKSGKAVNVGLEVLDKNFNDNDEITPDVLLHKNIIVKIKNKVLPVKILANGKITKRLTIKGCAVSKAAKQKIEKAGGKVI